MKMSADESYSHAHEMIASISRHPSSRSPPILMRARFVRSFAERVKVTAIEAVTWNILFAAWLR
jgi:hypothetical protein